ncbi:MAG: ATP-binding protein [Chitinophagales bacterium]
MQLIGRVEEKETFKHCLDRTESKLIALYGRRRVGKTFLVRQYFGTRIRFEVAGLYNGEMSDQLTHFAATLAKYGWLEAALHLPLSWKDAFDMLERFIDSLKDDQKKVIFLDELPWFDTPKSKFLMAFQNFWNAYCTKRNDIVCVICGSAASWMIKKILKNKGGLHNRVSERIRLKQFNLYETELFLKEKGIRLSQYDIAQLYLTTGGVPYYLDAVRKGESVVQFVNRACFSENGILADEYKALFSSLFDNSERHYQIVEALDAKKQGLTRKEIIEKTKLSSGGTLTNTLNELEESGFIQSVVLYGQNKTKAQYKLVDNFIIFYLKFMKSQPYNTKRNWGNIAKSQSWVSWSGLAFERLCFAHISQIKRALKLEAIESSVSPWTRADKIEGTQIDMLIDRADRVVNVCEIKFAKADFVIDKAYAKKLRNKVHLFSEMKANKRKNIFLTMITTFGVVDNEYCKELVQSEVVLEDLFLN